MKYKGRRQSDNVKDLRGSSGPVMFGGLGLIIALIFTFLTGDPRMLINQTINSNVNQSYVESAEEKDLAEFVSVVLADSEDVWHKVFKEYNLTYVEPQLVLFKNQVNSGCGLASSSSGPFYCPADQTIYIDLAFQKQLKHQFKATGDFAMAYVVAHEVGHHVQNLLGLLDIMQDPQYQKDQRTYNRILMRIELQADYLAGVWAGHQESNNLLDVNDIEEAMQAAASVGDDYLQEITIGKVIPDNFTHGTSEQRMRWFYKGYQAKNFDEGDTFQYSDEQL